MPVTLNMIPATLQEFQTCPQMDLSKPENTCAMFLCALQLYIKDRDAGVEAMNMLRGPRPMTPYDSQFLRDRLRDKPYLPLAYFEGAAPKNNYTPAQPYVLNVLPDPRQSVIFCGQFIHAILFCSLLLRLLSFDFSLRIFLAQAGQYLDAPEPGTYSTPHTVQFLAGIAAHRFVGMICNSSTKPMNL